MSLRLCSREDQMMRRGQRRRAESGRGNRGRRQSGEERHRFTDAESHIRGTTAASHESLGIMEELEHTCPHPRTVGHPRLCACFLVFHCAQSVCDREGDKGSCYETDPLSMWLWDMLRVLSGQCVCGCF